MFKTYKYLKLELTAIFVFVCVMLGLILGPHTQGTSTEPTLSCIPVPKVT